MSRKRRNLKWVAGSKTPPKTYITRVFNFGTWDEWKGLKKSFSRNAIKEAVKNPLPGQWTPRGKALAEVIFKCHMPKKSLISYDA
jgi:hypothetical protein